MYSLYHIIIVYFPFVRFLRKYGSTLVTGLLGVGMEYHPHLHTGDRASVTLAGVLESRDDGGDTPLMVALQLGEEMTTSGPGLASGPGSASGSRQGSGQGSGLALTPGLGSGLGGNRARGTMLELVRVLVQAGADVAARNRHTHMTPFLYAVKSGRVEVVEYLLTLLVPRKDLLGGLTEVGAMMRYFQMMSGQGPRPSSNNNNNNNNVNSITTTTATATTTATTTAVVTTTPTTTISTTTTSGVAAVTATGDGIGHSAGSGVSSGSSPDPSPGSASSSCFVGMGATPASRTVTTIDELVHPLAMYKCQPYLKDILGRNALMLAAENGHLDVVDTCLRIGIDFAGE